MSVSQVRRRASARGVLVICGAVVVAGALGLAVVNVVRPGYLRDPLRFLPVALSPARDVAVPADDASPQMVVRSYLDALDKHDIDTAKRLLTPGHRHEVAGAADSWFSNVRSIRNVRVGPAYSEHGRGGIGDAYAQAVGVPTSFDLRQYREDSMEDGNIGWAYILVRNRDSDPWRIAAEGQG